MDSRAHARAAVVASVLEATVIEPTPFHQRQRPAVHAEAPRRRHPLDLTATVFRYIQRLNGTTEPAQEWALVTACGRHHPHAIPGHRR